MPSPPDSTPPPTDEALVRGLRDGDPRALDTAYRHYSVRVYSFLRRLARDPHLADDLFQATWLRAAESARTLQPGTRLLPWLYTVARNLFLSDRRRAAHRDHMAAVQGDDGIPDTEARDALESLLERHSLQALEAALLTLPLAHREVLLLVDAEGLSGEDAAAVLGISHAALRQRARRARNALRERLLTDDAEQAAARPQPEEAP